MQGRIYRSQGAVGLQPPNIQIEGGQSRGVSDRYVSTSEEV